MTELSGMSEAVRELAVSRFRLIQPHLEEGRSLKLVAADTNLSFRTAQRWVSQYRKFGLAVLARKSRGDRGARRVVSAKMKAAIEGFALERPPLPIRSICRQVRAFAQTTGEPKPSYGTVYDLVREVPSALLILAHQGAKAYSEGYDLVHRREAARSNAIWQADHAQLGIPLIREDGQRSRLSLSKLSGVMFQRYLAYVCDGSTGPDRRREFRFGRSYVKSATSRPRALPVRASSNSKPLPLRQIALKYSVK